jgi:arylsulfatase A-like enzyme
MCLFIDVSLPSEASAPFRVKVNAVLNWIGGKTHDGSSPAPVPSVFGMNFQSVSVGEKLNEVSNGTTGGYSDSVGTPSAALLNEIEYVEDSVGKMVDALRSADLLDSTLIIISAKHGQSAVDPNRLLRIPGDDQTLQSPSSILDAAYPGLVAQTIEDDVSLIWLTDQSQTSNAVATLEANEGLFGGGQIFSGPSLALKFNSPLTDSRSPDIAVAPNVGVVYTGKQKKVAEHGGFAHDDRNVMLLVSNPELPATTFTGSVETRQIAPTILGALGLDPDRLQAVQMEHTQPLQQLPIHSTHRY